MMISILGCGWLGLPLAEALLFKGYKVKGSTTTEAKLEMLQLAGVYPFLIALNENGLVGDVDRFLAGTDVLIVDIPPKLRGYNVESYVAKIENLIPHIERSGIGKVLFVSTTSVYADDNSIVTEDTLPNPETESGKQVLAAENLLIKSQTFGTTVVRFGGLIGGDRHPVKYMAGKIGLDNPDSPVNLIHRDDCIGIIKAIIAKSVWGEVFNGVAPYHPTRKEYYTQKAIEFKIAAPKFNSAGMGPGKIVSGEKAILLLKHTYINP